MKGKENFLLIDEVQLCKGFEKAINGLHTEGLFDIFLTGSNAFLLSNDLATLFTGRVMEIKAMPFSLSEYMEYFSLTDPVAAFDSYRKDGGMPGSYPYPNEEGKIHYVKEVYEAIVQRDLAKRKRIRYLPLLQKISAYLMGNISNLTSLRNIAQALSQKTSQISDKTVASYVDYLCEAFLFYKIPRYDVVGKRYLAFSEKYCLVDVSFKWAILGKKNMDFGRVDENQVAIELLRRGYEVYVGKLYQKEIDFVAMKRDEKIYIQVSGDITSEDTFLREVAPLLQVRDAYPKYLLARTKNPETLYEGIHVMDLGDWLKGGH